MGAALRCEIYREMLVSLQALSNIFLSEVPGGALEVVLINSITWVLSQSVPHSNGVFVLYVQM